MLGFPFISNHSEQNASALAVALCLLLTTAWAFANWPDLVARRLPDPDDVMRLVQVRDWLGGQHWRDLTQHRLGLAGVPMHWSRLGDLGPAAIAVTAAPLVGKPAAETVAVILYPAALFLLFLMLSIRLASRIGGAAAAPHAAIIAALAWPATGAFMPGRIDHHGLQIVLLLTAAYALLRPPSGAAGATLGFATAASLTLGLETAPLLAVVLAGLVVFWLLEPVIQRVRLAATGMALLGGIAMSATLHPLFWAPELCDAFTPQSARATACAAMALLALAALPPSFNRRRRILATLGLAIVGIFALAALAPACLAGPYAAVPAELRDLWLNRVEEAQPAWAVSPALAFACLGVGVAGLWSAATTGLARRSPGACLLAALLATALLIACLQLRGAHLAAALAPAALAGAVVDARRSGLFQGLLAWLRSLGTVYALVGQAIAGAPITGAAPSGCVVERHLTTLRALPNGLVLAPIDLGPRILAETNHRVLAAPYHRNVSGNLSALRTDAGLAVRAGTGGADYRLHCDRVRALPHNDAH